MTRTVINTCTYDLFKNCSEDKVNSYQKPDPGLGLSQPTSRARSKNLESINLLDDVIILPRKYNIKNVLMNIAVIIF